MAAEDAPLSVKITVDAKDLEKGTAAAVRASQREIDRLKKSIDSMTGAGPDRVARSFKAMGATITQTAGAQSFAIKNLGFQISDVSVQIASGTGVVRAFATQADQLSNAILGIAGASAGLTAGISVGVGIFAALASAAVNYFSETEGSAKDASKALDEHRQKIAALANAYGDALPALQRYNEELKRRKELEDATAGAASTVDQLKDELKKSVGPLEKIFGLFDGFPQFADDINDVRKRYEQWLKDAEAGNATHNDTLKLMADISALLGKLPVGTAKKMGENFDASVPTIVHASDAIADLTHKTKDLTEQAKAAGEALKLNIPPPQQLPPVTSGAGVFDPSQTQIDNWNKTQDAIKGATGAAAEFIKKEEGFITGAKWDVNAFRVGFGSDTFVDDMGRVQKVTKDTVVTLDQANQDLARRIPEFQRTITDAIGPEMWKSLDEGQKAALTSIAYNYGSLPSSIVKAIQGGDRGQVAEAISNLSSNPARRKREAALYGGGAFQPKADTKNFDDLFAENEKRLAQRERENAINADSTLNSDQRTAALDREAAAAEQAKIAEQLLNAAKAQGLAITPELTAKINAQAESMANAGLKAKQLAADQKQAAKDTADQLARTQQLAQQMSGLAQSAIGGFISDLRAGVDAGEAFNNMLNRVIDSLIQMALQSVFSPANFMSLFGGGGGFPAAGGLYKRGGIVGKSRVPMAPVNPSNFIGARSYARGGMPGMPAGAIPAYLHPGELVIPKNMVGRAGRAGTSPANVDNSVSNQLGPVSIDMAGTGVVAAGDKQAKQFGENIRAMIAQEMVRESRPGGLLRTQGPGR